MSVAVHIASGLEWCEAARRCPIVVSCAASAPVEIPAAHLIHHPCGDTTTYLGATQVPCLPGIAPIAAGMPGSPTPDLLLAGTNGTVFAVDPKTGTEVWHNSFPGATFVSQPTLIMEDGLVFVGIHGAVIAVSAFTGYTVWIHEFKKAVDSGVLLCTQKHCTGALTACGMQPLVAAVEQLVAAANANADN